MRPTLPFLHEVPAAVLPSDPSSLLTRALRLLEASGPLRANFDDLTGITLDYPELALPTAQSEHGCAFCVFAKGNPAWVNEAGKHDCAVNKHAINGLVCRRAQGLAGLCHLGVFDIVEPLVYHGVSLGVFYYGQVAVREWRGRSLARIARHCSRNGLDPAPFRKAFAALPRITLAEAEAHRERLKTVAKMVALCCEAMAVPLDRYRRNWTSIRWRRFEQQPSLVRQVEAYVSRNFAEPCRVVDLARRFHCNANYLGAVFKRSVGCEIGEYVNTIRVERAKHLLQTARLSVGEISYKCGFSDQSYFGKVFRQFVSQSPAAFRAASRKSRRQP